MLLIETETNSRFRFDRKDVSEADSLCYQNIILPFCFSHGHTRRQFDTVFLPTLFGFGRSTPFC